MENKENIRVCITHFLQWEDSNGHYTDERCALENVPPMDYEEAVKFLFCVLNSDCYYKFADNFFELDYQFIIKVAKEQGFYDKTMCKLNYLTSIKDMNPKYFKELLD